MPDAAPLSVTEAGLLTVADRRGSVETPRVYDGRNDPASVERHEMLELLAKRGLLAERPGSDAELSYAITDDGRAALAALDSQR